jgi:uncharacterized protein YggE
VNNITTCETSKSVLIQLLTGDQKEIDKIIKAAENSGAVATIARYGLSDPSKAVSDAKNKAVENAMDEAQNRASAAGVKLGKVISISDLLEFPYLGVSMTEPIGLDSTKPGMVDVTSHMMVTYEIMG